jgi:hypothetical protein
MDGGDASPGSRRMSTMEPLREAACWEAVASCWRGATRWRRPREAVEKAETAAQGLSGASRRADAPYCQTSDALG